MTVYRLETSILRLFLVQATRQNKHDVVKDFFEKMADALHDKKEWKDWFGKAFHDLGSNYLTVFNVISVRNGLKGG